MSWPCVIAPPATSRRRLMNTRPSTPTISITKTWPRSSTNTMRKRRSPKGTRRPHRLGASRRFKSWLAGGIMVGSTVGLHAQADKGLGSDRVDRVERAQVQQADTLKAETEVWTPAKVVLNLDARCPVVLSLGYFGAFATNDKDPA